MDNRASKNSTIIEVDIDKVIEKLLTVKGMKPGKQVNLSENEIRSLCLKSRDIFISQPILLEIEAPLKICGNQNFIFLD